jgi:RNA polymerase sigma factor (sigma-70 family)
VEVTCDDAIGIHTGAALVRSDAELLVDSSGDPAAFRELYERYAASIHGYLQRRVGDGEAALDLTAETFAQAWQSRARFEDRYDGSTGPWLFGIARNLLLRSVRERRLIAEASARLGITTARSGIEPSQDWIDGLDEDLMQALEALPAMQRRAVELRVLRDQEYHQVAEDLGCSPGAARIRVSRGLAAMRSRLTYLMSGKAPS